MPDSCDFGLWSLFITSFLSATLLPGGSEAMLFGVIRCHPSLIWQAVFSATVGNTAGGMTSYILGRLFRKPTGSRYVAWANRYGSVALILAWAPVIGDALCVAAGWLRMSWGWCLFWMAVGKLGRYAGIAWTMSQIMS